MSEMGEMHTEAVSERPQKFLELTGFSPATHREPFHLEKRAVAMAINRLADEAARAKRRLDSVNNRYGDALHPTGDRDVLALAVQAARLLDDLHKWHCGRLTVALNLVKEFGFDQGGPDEAIKDAIGRYERDAETDWDEGLQEMGSIPALQSFLSDLRSEVARFEAQ